MQCILDGSLDEELVKVVEDVITQDLVCEPSIEKWCKGLVAKTMWDPQSFRDNLG